MVGHKIINDPVYGFISLPYGILYKIVSHPIFQRLRRIKQLGLSDYVYPGATNTRFLHALGAFNLMRQAIHSLRQKGVEITDEEAEAAQLAILLHDIGHGPYSHALESMIFPMNHEDISLAIMRRLNREFSGALGPAIEIFQGKYHKNFLHQLISGQLDMDRMDYLMRDSYFTGVAEGVIGYDRIIKMLNVSNNQLVIEEKGLYSIEKFLLARRLMYWQVYLHKTVVSAEKMLVCLYGHVKNSPDFIRNSPFSSAFANALSFDGSQENMDEQIVLDTFIRIDDTDIMQMIKVASRFNDPIIRRLATGLLNRKLFHIQLSKEEFGRETIEKIKHNVLRTTDVSESIVNKLILTGRETNQLYRIHSEEIVVLLKTGEKLPFSEISDNALQLKEASRYYICYPRG